jgi:membrane fusion protein (multidrug efflux system)
MKKWIILIVVLVAIIAIKFIFFPKKNEQKPAGPKSAAPAVANYFVAKTSPVTDEIFAAGKIGAFNQVEIVPEAPGKIVSLNIQEGEHVEKGALLAKLNDADLQAQLVKVRTQLKLAQDKSARLQKLLSVNGVSKEESEMQENEVMSLKADESFILAQIEKTAIRAPFSGDVGLKNISEGSFVSQNTVLVTLVQMQPLFVEFSVPEKYAGIVKKGSAVKFSPDRPGAIENYTATVFAVDPHIDELTKSLRTRAKYDGKKEFFPGTFVKVWLQTGLPENGIMVPTEAVIPTAKGQKVFIYRHGEAAESFVSIGLRSDKAIQVTQGVNVGDTVITTGLMAIRNGSQVKLLKQNR